MQNRIKTEQVDFWGNVSTPRPKGGYAGEPGTGPDEMQCKNCLHFCRIRYANTYFKCALIRRYWTNGKATDILASSPACKFFQADPENKTK